MLETGHTEKKKGWRGNVRTETDIQSRQSTQADKETNSQTDRCTDGHTVGTVETVESGRQRDMQRQIDKDAL